MSEIDKNKEKDASTNPENPVLVQGQENANPETKDEKQKVQKDTKPKAKAGGGGRSKAVKPAKVDSKDQAKSTSTKEGDQLGGEVTKEAVDKKTEKPLVSLKDLVDPENKNIKKQGKTDQRDKVAAEVFANNANCTKLFFTADDIPFFNENDAIKHAVSLDDKTIIPKYKE